MALYLNKKSGTWKVEVWHRNRRYITKTFPKKALAEKFERDYLAQIEYRFLTGSHARDCTYNEVYELWHLNDSSRKKRNLIS